MSAPFHESAAVLNYKIIRKKVLVSYCEQKFPERSQTYTEHSTKASFFSDCREVGMQQIQSNYFELYLAPLTVIHCLPPCLA